MQSIAVNNILTSISNKTIQYNCVWYCLPSKVQKCARPFAEYQWRWYTGSDGLAKGPSTHL